MIQLALRSALSDRAAQGRVALVDAWPFEVPSTKAAVAALDALGLSGRVLVVLGDEDGYADRSFGNLPEVQTIVAGELNAYDILVNDWVVFTDETLPGEATGGPMPPRLRGRLEAEAGATGTAEAGARRRSRTVDAEPPRPPRRRRVAADEADDRGRRSKGAGHEGSPQRAHPTRWCRRSPTD